jgi:hypothetical protein
LPLPIYTALTGHLQLRLKEISAVMPKSPPMTKQQRQVWWANFKAQQKREKKEEKVRIQLEKWEKYDAERRAKKEAKQAAPRERQEKEDDALLFASIKKIAPLLPMAFFSGILNTRFEERGIAINGGIRSMPRFRRGS